MNRETNSKEYICWSFKIVSQGSKEERGREMVSGRGGTRVLILSSYIVIANKKYKGQIALRHAVGGTRDLPRL